VTIAGVFPTLSALPTKTRPKRLELLGSDGAKYVFLLKGRDDLRMDERLMQVRFLFMLCKW
jgi:PI-3-kinase-related kinase SMG-1